MRYSMLLLVLALLVSSVPAHAEKWRELGTRWALKTDDSGHPLAIYDQSFPTILDRVRLALVNTHKLDARPALETLRQSGDQRALEIIAKLHESDIAAVEGASDEWWKQVPWKKRAIAQGGFAPESFLLSDIDFEGAAQDPKAFRKALKKLSRASVDQEEGPLLGEGFLSRIEFRRSGETGVYEVFWQPPAAARGSAVSAHGKKVVDFVSVYSGLEQALAWDSVSKLVGLAVGQIPIPWVQNLVSVALSQLFSYRDELTRYHEVMALEMLTATRDPAMEQVGFSPFSPLSSSEVDQGVRSVYYSESTLTTVWRWIIFKPLKTWAGDIGNWDKYALNSANWLGSHGYTLQTINPHFGFATETATGNRHLYSLSRYRLIPTLIPPGEAIDYQHPEKIRVERLATTAASMAGEFALHFIPTFGGTLASLYKSAVNYEMNDGTEWESRLLAHLWERVAAGETWDREIEILEGQRINPFEVSREVALELVAKRRQGLN